MRMTMHDGAYFEAVNGLCKARAPEGINFERFTLYRLRLDWSPEQIAGWLKRTHPEDECNQVSHETIYRSLFVQARGVLKKELLSHLRSKRSMRRSKPVDPNGDKRGHIKDIVSIRQRLAAVEDRAVPGHWEGDLLSGPQHRRLFLRSAKPVATRIEREYQWPAETVLS